MQFNLTTLSDDLYLSTVEIEQEANEIYNELEGKLNKHISDLLTKNKTALSQKDILMSTVIPGAILIVCVVAGIIAFRFIQSRRLKKHAENDNEENNDKKMMSNDTKMSV